MTPEQAQALVTVIDHPGVEEAARLLASGENLIKVRNLLEESFPPSTCLALLDCLTCRLRFKHKFENVDRWLLTREAAEQASSWRVGNWRARFLSEQFPDVESLMELGCGIGGDSVHLGSRFALTAFESEPARALLAQVNLQRNCRSPVSGSQILAQPADLEKSRGGLLFADPTRRTHKRLFRPEDWSPPLSHLLRSLRESRFSAVAVKCHPGLKDSDIPAGSQVHFLSIARAMKEAFLLVHASDKASSLATKTAWLWDPVEQGFHPHLGTPTEDRTPLPISLPKPGLFLHNPDPALLRARALARLVEDLEAGIVHPKIGYLVGPHSCSDNRCESFHINDVFPLNWKVLNRKLRTVGLSSVEILSRGLPFPAVEIRQRISKALKVCKPQATDHRGVIICYRGESDYTVVLAKRTLKRHS